MKLRGLGLGETRSTTPEAHQPSAPGRSAARLLSRAAAAVWHGAQVAIDATMVSPLGRDGQPRGKEDYAEQLARQPELCGRRQNMQGSPHLRPRLRQQQRARRKVKV